MTRVILPHAEFDADHLAAVSAEMETLGSPTIRAFPAYDMIVAIEGSHRLRAAEATGTPVNFEMLDEDGEIDLSTLDIDTNNWFDGETVVPVRDFLAWWTKDGFPMGAETVEVEGA